MHIDHDVHVHTFLSSCSSDPKALPPAILARAAEFDLRLIGFADHLWDSACPGASAWYTPQDVAHIRKIHEQLPAASPVKVLVGAESEYCGGGKVGISRAASEALDFVLLPMSHLHMRGFVAPPELEEPAAVGKLMVQRFLEVIELGLATGIAHPFLPCGHVEQVEEILGSITDDEFRNCFSKAAAAGVSIEITTGFFPSLSGAPWEKCWQDDCFLRMLAIARDCGCFFHFASDAHSLDKIGSVTLLAPFVDSLRLQAKDIHPKFRSA